MDTLTNATPSCYYDHSIQFFYEKSGKNISDHWRTRDYVVVSLGIMVCIIVILSNILVMMAIFINRRFHYPIYYLLGNLAAADLFAGVSYLHLMFHTGPWTIRLSTYQWFIRQGLIDTSLTASVINLLAVAVERHQTIFTMQLHSKMTNRRVLLLIAGIWGLAIFMGLVPTMGWHCLCDLEECSTMAPLYSRSYLVFWAVLNLFTFSVMVAVYTRIFLYVKRKSQRMSQHTTQARHKETVFNLMKTVSMILGCFVVCWTPGLVILLLDGVDCGCNVLTYEKYFLVLAECNSFFNPIIYSFRDKDMLKTFKSILCFACRRSRKGRGELSSVRFNTLEQENHDAVQGRTNGVHLVVKENVPVELQEPLYRDQYNQEHLKPSVSRLLVSPELYCRAQALLAQAHGAPKPPTQAPSADTSSLLQLLTKKGLAPRDQDADITEEDLLHTPIKTRAHLALIDALMSMAARETVGRVKMAPEAEQMGAGFPWENALLFWVNRLNQKLRESTEEEDAASSQTCTDLQPAEQAVSARNASGTALH